MLIRGLVFLPSGAYKGFVIGFVIDDERVWGRPVGIAQARDGLLLFTDDENGDRCS
jgi:glucose/arabinose dehydrogenase